MKDFNRLLTTSPDCDDCCLKKRFSSSRLSSNRSIFSCIFARLVNCNFSIDESICELWSFSFQSLFVHRFDHNDCVLMSQIGYAFVIFELSICLGRVNNLSYFEKIIVNKRNLLLHITKFLVF